MPGFVCLSSIEVDPTVMNQAEEVKKLLDTLPKCLLNAQYGNYLSFLFSAISHWNNLPVYVVPITRSLQYLIE